MNILNSKKGMALIVVYIMIVTLLILCGSYYWRSFNEFRLAQQQKDKMRAYYVAEAGLKAVSMDIYNSFRSSLAWQTNRNILGFHSWFGEPDSSPGWNATRRRNTFLGNYPNLPVTAVIDGCQYTVTLASAAADPIIITSDGALVKLLAIGIAPHLNGNISETATLTTSYEMRPSPIFNYAYFINNFGWLWGGGITVNGDVRSNGNFSFNGNPMINGDIYAAVNAALGAAGTISGNSRNQNLTQYQNQAPARARPTDPTNPANPGGTVYEAGYDGTSTRYQRQDILDVPYLGNLTTYRQLAVAENGQITQGGAVLVNHVYNGNGPDGRSGTADDGSMVLIGTAANPIVINGPVVVERDVVIRGVVSGQGTIYAGRNVHIVGDITYNSGPSWPKPDATPQATAQSNSTRDFLGLACKGNVIVGDYTRNDWRTTCTPYLKPPFTQGYTTEATDASIGYDSDNNPSNGYWFSGDYTSFDGGSKDNGRGGSTQRRYYESSLSDSYIGTIAAPSNQIRTIDGIIYNNHAISGKVGNFTVNGSIISRDEAIIYSGNITINYDVRAHGTGIESIDIYLPRDLSLPETRVSQGD